VPRVVTKPVEGDATMRLVGGRRAAPNGICHVPVSSSSKDSLNLMKSTTSSPRMTVPYSQPVNMLKALNYHSRRSHHGDGLYTVRTDGVVPGKRTASSTHDLRLLAAAYSTESLAATAARRTVYKLVSVVVHLGDAMSGHFITYDVHLLLMDDDSWTNGCTRQMFWSNVFHRLKLWPAMLTCYFMKRSDRLSLDNY
jgi:hypothetical protein